MPPSSLPLLARSHSSYHPVWPFLLGVVVVVISMTAVTLVKNSFAETPQKAIPADIASLVAAVKKHISVVANETPKVATVRDLRVLKAENPAFYQDAQVGDRVLFWSDKTVLYSVADDRILVVLPVNATGQK